MNPERVTPRFTGNEAYIRCQRLLKELQELMAAGDGDSERADAIRDAMEAARDRLDEAEARRIEDLSADLYMLTCEEIVRELPAAERGTLRERLSEAFTQGRYVDVLTLLRYGPEGLPREVIAYVRGRCWMELGEHEPAAWFLVYASQLAPGNPNYAALALEALVRAGRMSEAAARARNLIANPSAQPRVLFAAAHTLLRHAAQLDENVARPMYEQVIGAVERALDVEAGLPESERIPSVTLGGRLDRARALAQLGRESEVREAYVELTREHPTSSEAWTLRGLFEVGKETAQAVRSLEQAIALKPKHPWPYLFLARLRLREGHFEDVLRHCQDGMEQTVRPEHLARFHEWSALARTALGAPDDVVRAHLDTAIAYDPLNLGLRRNREMFERFAAARGTGPRPEYEPSPAPDIGEALRILGEHLAGQVAA